jgi:hypothetical protein
VDDHVRGVVGATPDGWPRARGLGDGHSDARERAGLDNSHGDARERAGLDNSHGDMR